MLNQNTNVKMKCLIIYVQFVMRYMEDYIENRGLSWSDIKYPTRTQGMQGVGSVLNYVSRNIERLYA